MTDASSTAGRAWTALAPLKKAAAEGFRPDIEGLRALAVSLVVAFHLGLEGMAGGFIGVDVFFVISGYLITGLLLKEIDRTGRLDLLAFYGRRIRRLLPTFFIVLAATLLVGCLILSPKELAGVGKSAVASATYVSNFWFRRQARDYFAPESATNPFLHTWSLSVEEQFYFVWPILLLVASRVSRQRVHVALFIAVAVVASLALCLWLVGFRQAAAFYASPTRAWEFGTGALATLVPTGVLRRHLRLVVVLGWAGLALVAAAAVLMSERSMFPSWSALVPVLGCAATLLAGKATDGKGLSFLGARPLQYLGRQSYAIYLWHWPVIVFALVLRPDLGPLGRFGCLVATLALAAASFALIESPIRSSPALFTRRGAALLFGLALTLAGALLGASAVMLAQTLDMRPDQQAVTRAQAETSALARQGCLVDLAETHPVTCRFGNRQATQRVVLFGDSHAAQWFTPIESLVAQSRGELVTVLKSSCAVADIPVLSFRLRRMFTECEAWRRAAVQTIIAMKPDAVVLSQHSLSYVVQPGENRSAASVSSQAWSAGLQRTLALLENAGIRTIVIADTPDMRFDVATCLGRSIRLGAFGSACAQDRRHALNAAVVEAEQRAVSAVPSARYADLTDLLCQGSTCAPTRDGLLLYRDANHITEAVAAGSVELLRQRLGPLANGGAGG